MKKMKLNIQLFGHTNETTNYDLPQFIGTDKPTWLGDINTAMASIDTGMATNANNITSLGTRVTSAEGIASQASSDVSGLTSTVNTLSGNVTTVTNTANNAQSTATSALNTANTADDKADTNASAISALDTRVDACEDNIADFNLSNVTTYTTSQMTHTGTYSVYTGSITVAKNTSGSLCKIYGAVECRDISASGVLTIPTNFDVDESFSVMGTTECYRYSQSGGVWNIRVIYPKSITFNTDGTISVPITYESGYNREKITFYACLIFVKDFGDTPVGE